MDNRIIELLHRNLQEVFGEGDAARRRAAIKDFYADDCVLYAPTGVVIGHDALDKFAGDLRATHPHFVYTPRGEPQALHNGGISGMGLGPERRIPRVHRTGCRHCSRWQDRCALCLSQSEISIAGQPACGLILIQGIAFPYCKRTRTHRAARSL